MNNPLKDTILFSFFGVLFIAVFAFALRGLPGNPSMQEMNTDQWKYNGPFELSPERGRFALLYSVIEDGSLNFSLDTAKFSTPDLAVSFSGKYASLFAPGVSFLVLPGYGIGKTFGAAQVGAFAIIAVFAVANFMLIRSIAIELGARFWSSTLGALAFSFATPAFAYGVTLYQHHVSVFLLLLSLLVLLRYSNYWSLAVVWFACAVSVVVDNPNMFLMFPVGLYSLYKAWILFHASIRSKIVSFGKIVLACLAVIPPVFLFLLYNFLSYGRALQLPGTLPSVNAIDHDGRPVVDTATIPELPKNFSGGETNNEKTAIGFFKTRNLYNGFYEHFVSMDRGMFFFAPVMVLGIFGFVILYRTRPKAVSFLVSIAGVNILLYSMWGDPYGGWAFGSRYLIPTYAMLAIGIGIGLSQNLKKYAWFFFLFFALFLYSAWVNTLGAITSSANPPKIQVLSIEKQTGHEEKYTFMRNWEFLQRKYNDTGSKSFVYQAFLKESVSPVGYFSFVYEMVILAAVLCFTGIYGEHVSAKKNGFVMRQRNM